MTPNVLLLSPFHPPHHALYGVALRRAGARALGIGDLHPDALPPSARGCLDDYLHVPELGDGEAVLGAGALLVHRWGRLAAVDSLGEHWMDAEAALREDLNVPGLRHADVTELRSKASMAATLAGAGLAPIPLAAGGDAAAVRALAAVHGYPLLAKPDVGVGASGTRRIGSADELERSLPELGGSVVQPFITGRLTSFDGLVDEDGRILFASSLVYRDPVLAIVEGGLDVLFWTRRTIPPRLIELGRGIVRAFDLRSRFFHAEAFELPDGSFVPLELNARPPGGYSVDMMNFGADVDLYQRWADVIVRGTSDASRVGTAPYAVAHAGRRERAYALSDREVRTLLGAALVSTPEPPRMIGEAMGRPIYLFRHEDERTLVELGEAVLRTR